MRITNGWNKECLSGMGGGGGKNALFKIAAKQYLRHLPIHWNPKYQIVYKTGEKRLKVAISYD